ncbi:MAG: flagellar basal-body rod protein FlgG [Armatimonadetes bacterium]|nr:flagellar basal-body rod protein FlgG [Armatimonadota bacterium]
MMRSLTTAATGMISQQQNLDTISNNLANVNTNGFKAQRAEFQDIVYQTVRASGASTGASSSSPIAVQIGLGSKFAVNSAFEGQGPLTSTGNPTDLAIQGQGYFQVQMPDGSTGYTRDGSFKLDSTGQVVTNDGYQVIPSIQIPAGSTAVSISGSGLVTAVLPGQSSPTTIGQITIATFSNPAGLTRLGHNLYAAGGASGDPQVGNPGSTGFGSVEAGFVEGSNVQVVEEMVKMIVAQRAYEVNSKAIQTADEMLQTVGQLKR